MVVRVDFNGGVIGLSTKDVVGLVPPGNRCRESVSCLFLLSRWFSDVLVSMRKHSSLPCSSSRSLLACDSDVEGAPTL